MLVARCMCNHASDTDQHSRLRKLMVDVEAFKTFMCLSEWAGDAVGLTIERKGL